MADKKVVELVKEMRVVAEKLAELGHSTICIVAEYDRKKANKANFHGTLSIKPVPELGVTEDHVYLDVIREISNAWSEEVHDKK